MNNKYREFEGDMIGKYPVQKRLAVSDNRQLVVLMTYYNENYRYPEIAGVNLFMMDNSDNAIWQISAPLGSFLNPKTGVYIIKDSITDVIFDKDAYIFVTFQGMVYKIELDSGKSTFLYWEKN